MMTCTQPTHTKGLAVRAADFWDDALDLETYIEEMTLNQSRFRENLRQTRLTDEELERFRGPLLRFLVLTEDFCSDSYQFIPPVGALAEALDNIEIRVLHRDQHKELADNYRRKDGYQAIPVFIILDAAGNEPGYLVERPERISEEMASETRRFAAEHADLPGIKRAYANMPEETRAAVKAHNTSWRSGKQEAWTRILLEDLAEIVARSPVTSGDD